MKKLSSTRLLLSALLCVSTLAPRIATAQAKAPETPLSVKVTQLKRGEIARNISLPATIAANQQVSLYAKVTGYLKTINVDKGDAVKEGDVLAEIEVPELIAELAKSKAELEIAQLDYKRTADAQKKAPDLIVAQSVDTAKAKQAMAKATMEKSETLLGFTKITAPFSGVVTRRNVDRGAFIPAATPGAAAGSAILSIADFKTVRVQIAVPEPEVPFIKNGLPVKVSVDELPGKTFQGTVVRFAHVLDELSKTMLTEVDLENPNGDLRPGMYATAKISVERHADAPLLPIEAVVVEKMGSSVFTVVDGKAKKKPVKTGFNDGVNVEILEGVLPADAVVIAGKMVLNNGQAVSVAENK